LKVAAAKKDQEAKQEEENEQNKEDNKAIRKELDKNAKAKKAAEMEKSQMQIQIN